ncbi:hypothetical protein F4677DRAFT_430270 [Hypoxylon crocopeplum]|nr:hypothetical protein F4677DRAFT_430270 [Hypoxylon crocopeplum]
MEVTTNDDDDDTGADDTDVDLDYTHIFDVCVAELIEANGRGAHVADLAVWFREELINTGFNPGSHDHRANSRDVYRDSDVNSDAADAAVIPTTFHGFSRLPQELKDKIWEEAVHGEDRIVTLVFKGNNIMIEKAPVPNLLFVDRAANEATMKLYIRFKDGNLHRRCDDKSASGPLLSFKHDILFIKDGGELSRSTDIRIATIVQDVLNHHYTLHQRMVEHRKRFGTLGGMKLHWKLKLNWLIRRHQAKRFAFDEDKWYFPIAAASISGHHMLLWALEVDELWGLRCNRPPSITLKKELVNFGENWQRYRKRYERWCSYTLMTDELRQNGRNGEADLLQDWSERCLYMGLANDDRMLGVMTKES